MKPEEKRRKKKQTRQEKQIRQSTILAVTVLLGMLTGCSRREEAELLEKKTQQEVEEQRNQQQEEASLDVIQLVQAPNRYQASLAGEKVSVEADAEVIVPEAEGFYEYRVESSDFTREAYNRVCQALLEGQGMELYDEKQENGRFYGEVPVGEECYYVSVQNGSEKLTDFRCFSVENMRGYGSSMLMGTQEEMDQEQKSRIPAEKCDQMAQELIEKLELKDFAMAGSEYCLIRDIKDREQTRAGYAVHFTRMLDGILETYTDEEGNAAEGAWAAWPYEGITVAYDEQGFLAMRWREPCQAMRSSDDKLFLMPYSDIQSVFETLFLEKYASLFENMQATASFQIHTVKLGYMRVHEKGNVEEGELIPVWDFFGEETIFYDQAEPYVEAGPYKSLLTINAIDGTVIDRGLGY